MHQVFIVTYPKYEIDVIQTPEWLFIKEIMDEFAIKGVEEEISMGYMTEEEFDCEDKEEDKDHEGQGLPSTS